MNKFKWLAMGVRLILTVVLVAGLGLASFQPVQAAEIVNLWVDTDKDTVGVQTTRMIQPTDDTFDVMIYVDQADNPRGVLGLDMFITFDKNKIKVGAVVDDGLPGDFMELATITNNNTGMLTISRGAFSAYTENFTVVRITFEVQEAFKLARGSTTDIGFSTAQGTTTMVSVSDGGTPPEGMAATSTFNTATITMDPGVTLNITGSDNGTAIETPKVAGTSFSITVQAWEQAVQKTTYTGNITFTSTDPLAVLPADYSFQASDNGTRTFTGLVLKTVGIQTITATDTTTGTITGTSANVTVNPAAASTLIVAGITDPVVAGVSSDVTVTAKDAYGNTATGYTGRIRFTSTDGKAVLPDDYTFQAGDSGVKAFAAGVTLKTKGEQTVTATDTTTGSITGTQSAITVNAAAATQVKYNPEPASAVAAGATWTEFKAEILDEFDNLTNSTADVTVAPSAGAFASGTTTRAAVAGVATFNNLTYTSAGIITVTASSAGLTSATSSNVTVNPASAVSLTVSGITDPLTANVASNVTVTAKDTYGNTATGYTGTIAFTSTDTLATLPANYTFLAGDAGVKTFTGGVKLVTYGEQSVTARDTVTSTITGTQSAITVIPVVTANITLGAGWNMFSPPVPLESGYRTWAEVKALSGGLSGLSSSPAYYYDPSYTVSGVSLPWRVVTDSYVLQPGTAIYVKMASQDTAAIVASTSPAIPSKSLYAGWNLVGLGYLAEGQTGMAVDTALTSVYTVTGTASTGYAQVVSPALNQAGWYYLRDNPGGGAKPNMLIGKGYWVYMVNPGTLAGFTATPLP